MWTWSHYYTILYLSSMSYWPIPAWPIFVLILCALGFWIGFDAATKRGDWLSVKLFKKSENRPEPVYEVHYENRLFASGTFSPEQLQIDTTMGVTSRFGPTPVRLYRLLFSPKHPNMAEHPKLKNAIILHQDKNLACCTEQLTVLLETH